MRAKFVYALAVTFLSSLPCLAADPVFDSSPTLQKRAAAVSDAAAAELQRKAIEARKGLPADAAGDDGDKSQKGADDRANVPSVAKLHEIGGAGNQLVATFRLPDGQLKHFIAHQIVPSFGTIQAITDHAVQDERGHWHNALEDAE